MKETIQFSISILIKFENIFVAIKYIGIILKLQFRFFLFSDDQFILNFLRGCKFDLELTKKKIVNFYTMRTASVEFCTNRDPFLLEMQNLFESGYVTCPKF